MPITWNDFDKIWAVSSPLTPYTFSDLNYAAGWNFIGSTPPARQMWDSLQKANDEKFKFLRDNFGTPNMVTTAAQMTDTDKIYVYVGSEAGWNNGHWYYYDADTSTWVDGGVYNSTAFVTDTTLTEAGKAADAKAVGDALALKADLAGATFTGNVAVNADFSTTGDATVASDLTVSGATNLTGNVTASGNVSVVGDIDADNITLTGDISATDVTASGDVTAGALSVSGATTLTGNVTAGADITATGDVTANDANFVNATLSGTLSVTGATTLDGLTAGSVSAQSLNTTGNVTVGGTLTVSGATTLADITTGDINANDITATGDISADDITANTLTVSGASTLTGNITAGADITVTGDLSVNDITASGDITADDVTANGNLSVVGNATLNGTSTAVTPAVDDNSTNIATTAYVQTEIKPIEADVSVNDKRISNIEKLLQGNLYDYQTDTDSAYTKTVTAGAMPYASLEQIGGKTLVWNQLMPTISAYSVVSGSTDGLTITITDNTLTVVGTTTSAGMIQIQQGAGTIPANHKLFLRKSGSGSGSYSWGRAGFALQGNDAYIQSHTADFGCFIRIAFASDTTYNFTAQFNVTDMTLCYGSGNEPTSVAEFTAQFPAPYYAFTQGTLMSAGVTEVVSKGKNLLPNTFPSNKINATINNGVITTATNARTFAIPCQPNTNYYASQKATGIGWTIAFSNKLPAVGDTVDTKGNMLNRTVFPISSGNNQFLIISVPYEVVLTTDMPNNEAMIEVGTTKTDYSPYHAPIITPIPTAIQQLEGYGWSAENVYNYVDYQRKVFVKNIGKIDLGSLNYNYYSNATAFYAASPSDSRNRKGGGIACICARYKTAHWGDFSGLAEETKAIEMNPNASAAKRIYIRDDSFETDAEGRAALKESLQGVYLYYELDEPVEIDISAYLTDDNLISVEAGGSLTFPNSNGDDYRINVPSAETYMVDLQASL